MRLGYVLAVAACLLIVCGSASGEFYQYTDESGVLRFTDDPYLIPDDQQPNVRIIESVQSAYNPDEASSEVVSVPGEDTEVEKIGTEARELDRINADLLSEFNSLQSEKEALGDPPSQTATTRERDDYNEKVTALNRKIETYQQRKTEYQEKVDAFNSRIGQK